MKHSGDGGVGTCKKVMVFIPLTLALLLAGCSRNTEPAAYVADVVVYGEGYQAFVCYFVLADSLGRETATDGSVTLQVFQEQWSFDEGESSELIYQTTLRAHQEDFQTATVGQGPFKRKRLIYYVGRILYSQFFEFPTSAVGTVKIDFRTNDGRHLLGKATILFDTD